MKFFIFILLIGLCRFSVAADTNINSEEFFETSEFATDSFRTMTSWWPDSFSVYSCEQKCGLTDNTGDWVKYSAISEYDAKSALYTFCSNKGMSLRGNPTCTESKKDLSASESHARCRAGNLGETKCNVIVGGYDSKSTTWHFFDAYDSSYDLAETKAKKKCSEYFSNYSTCQTRNWKPY